MQFLVVPLNKKKTYLLQINNKSRIQFFTTKSHEITIKLIQISLLIAQGHDLYTLDWFSQTQVVIYYTNVKYYILFL